MTFKQASKKTYTTAQFLEIMEFKQGDFLRKLDTKIFSCFTWKDKNKLHRLQRLKNKIKNRSENIFHRTQELVWKKSQKLFLNKYQGKD